MPYSIVKTGDGYGVKNTETGKFKSRNTSKANAMAQMRLLQGVKHGWHPTGKKKNKKKKTKPIIGYRTEVHSKMRNYGDADFDKKLVRVNPKKGEVINTVIHERLHMRNPKVGEKRIRKLAGKIEKKMPLKEQAKILLKLARSKPKE